MKYSAKEVIRFLFPEIQIVDAIKQEGFIAKKQKNSYTNNVYQNHNLVSGSTAPQQTVSASSPMTNAAFQATSKTEPEYVAQQNSVSTNQDKKFDGLADELRKAWISSDKNLMEVCEAFRRPYVMGYDTVKPKNIILMVGSESHGKAKAITEISKILKQRKVLRYPVVAQMDLKNYPTNAEDAIFINDLYKALYGQTDVVIFENIDKTDFRNISIFHQLIQSGAYQLQKRYTMQNNMLVESTGMLNTSAISSLSANGKFFVFTSTLSENKIIEQLGNEFSKLINDIIVMDNFQEADITEITRLFLDKMKQKVSKQLQINLLIDNTAMTEAKKAYKVSTGAQGLQDYIECEIYKPLVEYRMKNSVKEAQYLLKYEQSFVIENDEGSHILASYVKKYDTIALENVKKELSNVIGLTNVKNYVLNLENNLSVQKLRESKGLKAADISMHMIFTGNPGTGKTTIARIVAKYLKAIDVLTSGQLREVSRSDLVGQYVGHTAKLTTEIIQSAIGGVLFIDEAYSLCRDKNDAFGLEAIDALVKGIEDNRDNLVVILAGYSDEMRDFLKSNPGLKSRFPNVIDFEDYSPEEMYQIALITAKGKGYRIDDSCRDALLDEFERKQIKGRNDGGNGRLVRNLIEAAILKQSQRIAKDNTQDLELLTVQDFGFDVKKEFNLEQSLDEIIGLDSVKDFVKTQYHVILAREKRKKANLEVDTSQSLNMVFSGNPGTGKTTMARLVAEMFHSMGLLKSGHLIETDKGGLIAEYVGHTAKKTEDVFKSALGGVLFIDEAYAITNDGSSFGQECIDTLVKLIEDFRGEILVILAGYTKEMNEFMKANSGLESRFPLKIEFPDYTADELFAIGKKMIVKNGFQLTKESEITFNEAVYNLKKHATATSGNGRMVRNFIDEIIRKQSSRIATSDVNADAMTIILPTDIISETSNKEKYDLEQELSKVVGLETVKTYIRGLNARLRVQEERKKQGLKVNSAQTLHMIFKGNPGTGKTMMARTVANVLFNMGIISTNKLVETDRSGLVAGYVGQTALKTREVIENALNGVLFIDEAYSLAQGGNNDFGKESIDTLVKMMDDNRERLVVILAGYSDDMQNFLNQNAGLESRFPNIIEFPDYTTDDLLLIAKQMYKDQGYELDEQAIVTLKEVFAEARKQQKFGNGRFVRNIYEKSLNAQALRLSKEASMSADNLILIESEDIKEAL